MYALQVRLSPEVLAVLRDAAQAEGCSRSEFVRRAIEARARGRTPQALARAVAMELLPEIERLLEGLGGQHEAEAVPARSFDRGCIDVDLHQVGHVCSTCGGSFSS